MLASAQTLNRRFKYQLKRYAAKRSSTTSRDSLHHVSGWKFVLNNLKKIVLPLSGTIENSAP